MENLVTFTEEILNGKYHFLCSEVKKFHKLTLGQPMSGRKTISQFTQNDITNMNLKSYLKQCLHYSACRSQMFYKKGIPKNFLRPAALLKKIPQYWCFYVNFGKILRTPLFIKHLYLKIYLRRYSSSFSFRALKEEGSDGK